MYRSTQFLPAEMMRTSCVPKGTSPEISTPGRGSLGKRCLLGIIFLMTIHRISTLVHSLYVRLYSAHDLRLPQHRAQTVCGHLQPLPPRCASRGGLVPVPIDSSLVPTERRQYLPSEVFLGKSDGLVSRQMKSRQRV
jgi:hypothetical protein